MLCTAQIISLINKGFIGQHKELHWLLLCEISIKMSDRLLVIIMGALFAPCIAMDSTKHVNVKVNIKVRAPSLI